MGAATWVRLALGPVLLAAMMPLAARPCSDATLHAALKAAYPQYSTDGSSRITELADGEFAIADWLAQCKRWPADPDLLLVAVPLLGPDTRRGVRAGDLEVLVVDAATTAVRARYRDRGRLNSDAIYFDGLSLDTARYQLTDTLRAFGVRINVRNGSGPNPFREQSLDLYVLRGNALAPVMKNLGVRSRWSEWGMKCEGMHTRGSRTVAVAPVQGSAWADLVIRSHDRAWRTKVGDDGDCVESDVESSRTAERIRFDGQRYPLPANLEVL